MDKYSEIGQYANICVKKISEINDNILVSEFMVMPNHIHMIVQLYDSPLWSNDERLPQCDSPTVQNKNDDSGVGSVGLLYHGSRSALCRTLQLSKYV